jgi:hypothetical protein
MVALLVGILSGSALALTPRAPLSPAPLHAWVPPDGVHAGHRLTVKFVDAAQARAVAGALHTAKGLDPALADAIAAHGLRFRPLLPLAPGRLAALQARAEARSGVAAADLAGIHIVDLGAAAAGAAALEAAGEALLRSPLVEYAHIETLGLRPPGDLAPPTPDWSSLQGYLDADPGIDARAAWALGLDGAPVRVSDCEYGWETWHEDLLDRAVVPEPGQTIPSWVAEYGWDDHGTAVLGQVGGTDSGYGVTGIVPAAPLHVYPEWSDEEGGRRAAAIAAALADSAAGDIVLLEMQGGGRPGGSYGPAELDPNVWVVVEAGVAAGVVVVGAAGNGGEDLDAPWYQENYLSRGHSGAILVGAGSPDTRHDALYFSTFGSRVDLQGWGEAVFTLGYGDHAVLGGDPAQTYTAAFGGTSGASPIVTGAAAAVQHFAIANLGGPLSPADLRDLLVETGIPQGSGGNVGPLPDLAAAFARYDGDGDGQLGADYGGPDCDDADPAIYAGAADAWYDGVDSDCAGNDDDDADADGAPQADDCDDTDPAVQACPDGGGDGLSGGDGRGGDKGGALGTCSHGPGGLGGGLLVGLVGWVLVAGRRRAAG